jgi:hypothetical protein
MTRGWTEERRRKQAEMIRKHKPWDKSTGPKSSKGKAKSSMNALKSGGYSQSMKKIEKALKHNRAFMKAVKEHYELEHRNETFLAAKQALKRTIEKMRKIRSLDG